VDGDPVLQRPRDTCFSACSRPRCSSRRSAGYNAPGLGWYTLAGEELNIFFSPYPERGSSAMTPSSTCSKSVSGRPAAPGDAAWEDAIALFQ
jgi:hypothetical protein